MPRRRRNKGIILCLTGGLASGKTTVARMFRSAGAQVIDADKLARRLLRRGTPLLRRLASGFGKTILSADGRLDRSKLVKVVFRRRAELARLNRMAHPEIIRLIKQEIRQSCSRLIVLDAPLLLEAGLKGMVDKVVVVKAGLNQQLRRAGKKTGLGRREILRRIRAQMPLRQKARLADLIIDNSGSLSATSRQVKQIRRDLWKS